MTIAFREISGQRKKHEGFLCQDSSGAPALEKSAIENDRHVTFRLGNLDIARMLGRLSKPKYQ